MGTSRGIKREEMEARIEYDDGCGDDAVYVNRRPNTNKVNEGFTYHESLQCQHVAQNDRERELSREAAQLRWKAPCLECVLTDYDTQKP